MPPFSGDEGFGSGGGFGVRRPLRFLAHKLELDEKQVVLLARILDQLKTERAQASVDDRRALGEFADALAGDAFDTTKAAAAGDRRVESNKRLRETSMSQFCHARRRLRMAARLAFRLAVPLTSRAFITSLTRRARCPESWSFTAPA